ARADPCWLTLLGASGSGKSSLLQAGLAPQIIEQKGVRVVTVRPGGDAWVNLRMALRRDHPVFVPHLDLRPTRPETRLCEVVDAALASEPPESCAVVLVDQFEELFTSKPTERAARERYEREVTTPFLENLSYAARGGGGRVFVICAIRRDFFDELAEDP